MVIVAQLVRALACEAKRWEFESPRSPTINNNQNLKLAIQKNGRLTEDTVAILKRAGLSFESYKSRLFSTCRNFPLDILYVRDDDICDYVASGTVDLGIIGQNMLYELRPTNVKKLLNLRFGFCSLCLAASYNTKIKSIADLKNMKIATSYPNSVKSYLKKKGLTVETIKINGSVEIAPALDMAPAIADLVSTGSTLALNDLKIIEKIYDSEAVLIVNGASLKNKRKSNLIDKLLIRFKAVLSAKNYKYISLKISSSTIPKLKRILPNLSVSSVQSVIKEDALWEIIDKLKLLGCREILVLPVEKIIN